MTGKADAVRAVSQQFKDRTNTVIEGIMAHLRDDNAEEILGPGLSPLIGRGSLKSIVTLALYADVLRMVRDMVMADGEVSDEEAQASLGLLSVIAAGFAKVRGKDYAAFTQLTLKNARQFLLQYESDAGLFGHANESTKWAGVHVCRSIDSLLQDAKPLHLLERLLGGWAEQIAATDDINAAERHSLQRLRETFIALESQEDSADPIDAEVLTEEHVNRYLEDPQNISLSSFTTITNGAADRLATGHNGYLNLRGLTRLRTTAARSLARHTGWLELPSVTYLSDDAIEAIAEHSGPLCLDGLSSLSDAAVKSLASRKEGVSLDGVTSLSDSAIAALSTIEGSLLSLCGLTNLSDKGAGCLSGFNGDVHLNGLTRLSDCAIAALTKIEGTLSLRGLTSISDEAARELSRVRGDLILDGLTRLSDDAADCLATHEGGELSLLGLRELSDTAVTRLGVHSNLQCELDDVTPPFESMRELVAYYAARGVSCEPPPTEDDYARSNGGKDSAKDETDSEGESDNGEWSDEECEDAEDDSDAN